MIPTGKAATMLTPEVKGAEVGGSHCIYKVTKANSKMWLWHACNSNTEAGKLGQRQEAHWDALVTS